MCDHPHVDACAGHLLALEWVERFGSIMQYPAGFEDARALIVSQSTACQLPACSALLLRRPRLSFALFVVMRRFLILAKHPVC